jgi:hypothetical protein
MSLSLMLAWVWLLNRRRGLLSVFAAVLALSFAAALGWTIYAGALHPGRPDAGLEALNGFIRSVTSEMDTLNYLINYFGAIPTLLPSLIVLMFARFFGDSDKTSAAGLACWVLVSLAVYAILGLYGFSRLPRYMLLSIPAALLLFAQAIKASAKARECGHVRFSWFARGILYASLAVEIAEGLDLLISAPNAAVFFPIRWFYRWI